MNCFGHINMKKTPSIVAYFSRIAIIFSTGLAAQPAKKHKSNTTKTPNALDWVFKLGSELKILSKDQSQFFACLDIDFHYNLILWTTFGWLWLLEVLHEITWKMICFQGPLEKHACDLLAKIAIPRKLKQRGGINIRLLVPYQLRRWPT